jgi:ankyrin repeat protein
MIGLLMDAGADPELKNALGQTATQVAKINGNDEAAQAILVLANTRSASAVPDKAGGASEETTKQ